MSSEEEFVAGMLDCQQQLVARVVLAGWTFEMRTDVVRLNAGYVPNPKAHLDNQPLRQWYAGDKVVRHQWRAISPELIPNTGATTHTAWYDDKYGACCEAFAIMEDDKPRDTTLDTLFQVPDGH